jgi:hypothetical protein
MVEHEDGSAIDVLGQQQGEASNYMTLFMVFRFSMNRKR